MRGLVYLKTLGLPTLITTTDERAAARFLDFFTANNCYPNTRKACARALGEFLSWCEMQGVGSLGAIQPVHVSAYVEHCPASGLLRQTG